MKYQANLDSIRGVAAIAVVLFHWQHYIAFGWIGVEIFFALSGYLITGILLEQKIIRNGNLGSFFRFFIWRRALRLIPLYVGFFVIIALVLGRTQPDVMTSALLYIVTYTVNLGLIVHHFPESWNMFGHTWSLAVEWQFYLFWPIVVWFSSRKNLSRILVLIVLVAPLARLLTCLVATKIQTGIPDAAFAAKTVYHSPWSHFDALAWGSLLHWGATKKWLTSRLGTFLTGGAMVGSAVAMTLLYATRGKQGMTSLGFPLHMSNGYEFVWGYSLIAVASAWVIVHAGSVGTGLYTFLDNALLRYMGKISYGIYVFHYPIAIALLNSIWIKNAPQFGSHALVGLSLLLSLTLGFSHLSYVYFESLFLKLKSSDQSRVEAIAMTLAIENSGSDTR